MKVGRFCRWQCLCLLWAKPK